MGRTGRGRGPGGRLLQDRLRDGIVRPDDVEPGAIMRVMRVPPELAGTRVDRFLQGQLRATSRTRSQLIIQNAAFTPDGKRLKKNHRVQAEERVILWRPPWDEIAPIVDLKLAGQARQVQGRPVSIQGRLTVLVENGLEAEPAPGLARLVQDRISQETQAGLPRRRDPVGLVIDHLIARDAERIEEEPARIHPRRGLAPKVGSCDERAGI